MDILTKQIKKVKKEFEKEFGKRGSDGNIYIVTSDSRAVQTFLEQSIRESVVAVVSELRMEEKKLDMLEVDDIFYLNLGEVSKRDIIDWQYVEHKFYNQAVKDFNSKIDNICKK